MTEHNKSKDLQIGEDFDYQRRSWVFERVGWLFFAAVILCAAAGLFGRGLIGPAISESDSGALAVEYPRFWRIQSPMALRLLLTPREQDGGELRVWIDRTYLESFHVSQVVPEPQRVEAGSDRLTFVFALGTPLGPTAVTFDIEPSEPWRLAGRVGLGDRDVVDFAQFIYP